MFAVLTKKPGQIARRGLLLFPASLILPVLLAGLMLRPGSYLSAGNLHDILIPYNSALAAAQGLVLHQDFHTPFGWVYAGLNHFGWKLIHASGGLLAVNDLITVTALVWTLAVIGAYFTIVSRLPDKDRPAWLLLWLVGQFIIFVSFNFRGLSSFSVKDISWYGTYNNHLWGLFFLQLVSLFSAMRVGLSKSTLIQLACSQSLCIALALNYKISFGLASILLAVAVLAMHWPGWRWRYTYATTILVLVSTIALLLAPEHYSYSLYLQDLGYALQAKSEKESGLSALALLVGFAVIAVVLLWQRYPIRLADWLDLGTLRSHRRALWHVLIVAGLLALAINLAIAGDYARPYHYIAALISLLVLIGPYELHPLQRGKTLQLVAMLVLATITLLQIQTNLRIARYKTVEYQKGRYQPMQLSTAYGPLAWTLDASSSYDSLTRLTRLDEQPNFATIVADLAFPEYEKGKTTPPVFFNGDYVAGLNAALQMLDSLSAPRNMNIVMLEFTNPMPLLLGSPLAQGSFHWVHFGTSVPSRDGDTRIQSQWKGTDLLIMPVAAIDGYSQWLMNCRFHAWNERNARPFVPFAFDRFHIYYTRDGSANALPAFRGAEIDRRCDALLEKYRTGLMKP